MKYITVLMDGAADEPIPELGGRTAIEAAETPNLDEIAPLSAIGMVRTIPEGMAPGSDTANLAVLGYDPAKCYSGRSPLEALSIGAPMNETDVAIRCNIVTLTEDAVPFDQQVILDHSSGEISTEDCAVLLHAVADELANDEFEFYVGTSYRHCLIWHGGEVLPYTPPHDVLGQAIGQYLPQDVRFRDMMKRSYEILKNHPINERRKSLGLNPANCCWFWGAGTKPQLSDFTRKTGKKGFMVSAVDLLKGIATGAGMGVARVPGATGGLDTDYEGKAHAALDALDAGYDYAYIHIEAPDEMGHQGSPERKVEAIHRIDTRIIGPILETLKDEDIRLLVMPDHPTPVRLRTHTADPIPYLLYDSSNMQHHPGAIYSERYAAGTGIMIADGYTLIERLLG